MAIRARQIGFIRRSSHTNNPNDLSSVETELFSWGELSTLLQVFSHIPQQTPEGPVRAHLAKFRGTAIHKHDGVTEPSLGEGYADTNANHDHVVEVKLGVAIDCARRC